MKLPNAENQQKRHPLYVADGTMTAGGTAQLVLAQSSARSLLILGNNSAEPMVFEIGSARATATITNGVVTSCSVTNAGFNFTRPPVIEFMGGGQAGNSSYLGLNQPNGPSPNSMNGFLGRPANGVAVMTGSAGNLSLSSISIGDGGAGYAISPYVFIYNSDLDPYGVALPALGANSVGLVISSGMPPLAWNGTCCPNDSISVISATTGSRYLCRWMD